MQTRYPGDLASAADGGEPDLSRDLMIVGLARDCASTLEPAVQALAAAMPGFHRVRWCVIESDSSDDTVAVLERLAATRPDFAFRSLGRLRERMPLRTERIAHCRNAYLDLLRADPERERIGYVVVADLDGICSAVDREGLASCWSRGGWDACTANARGPYYDIWALRHSDWCAGDCWRQNAFLIAHGRRPGTAEMASVYARMIELDPQADWIEVDSAFGGLAVYRTEALLAAHYVGIAADGSEVCEHVALHAAMRERGSRIFINPRLLVTGTAEHARFWHERQQLERITRGLAFRALLRLCFGRQRGKALRRLIDSVV